MNASSMLYTCKSYGFKMNSWRTGEDKQSLPFSLETKFVVFTNKISDTK